MQAKITAKITLGQAICNQLDTVLDQLKMSEYYFDSSDLNEKVSLVIRAGSQLSYLNNRVHKAAKEKLWSEAGSQRQQDCVSAALKTEF